MLGSKFNEQYILRGHGLQTGNLPQRLPRFRIIDGVLLLRNLHQKIYGQVHEFLFVEAFIIFVLGNLKHQAAAPQLFRLVAGSDFLKTHHQNLLIPTMPHHFKPSRWCNSSHRAFRGEVFQVENFSGGKALLGDICEELNRNFTANTVRFADARNQNLHVVNLWENWGL